MEFRDLDEYTVMHMMGYGCNIFTEELFREVLDDGRIDINTLQWIAKSYLYWWGSNSEIKAILKYLEEKMEELK